MWISKKNFDAAKNDSFIKGRDTFKDRIDEANGHYAELEKRHNALLAETKEVHKALSEVKEKVRAQAENDMIAEALKVIIKGVQGEKKEILAQHFSAMAKAQNLAQQSMGFTGQRGYAGLLGNALSNLGNMRP